MGRYICRKCGHVSGYHQEIKSKGSRSFGGCRIIGCNCQYFVWDEEELEEANQIKYQNRSVI